MLRARIWIPHVRFEPRAKSRREERLRWILRCGPGIPVSVLGGACAPSWGECASWRYPCTSYPGTCDYQGTSNSWRGLCDSTGKDRPPHGGGGGAALNGMRCGSGAAQVLASSAQAKLNSSAVLRVTKMPVRGHRRRGVGMLNEQGLGETQREIGLCHRGRIEQCRARRRRRHALMREGALVEVVVVRKVTGKCVRSVPEVVPNP